MMQLKRNAGDEGVISQGAWSEKGYFSTLGLARENVNDHLSAIVDIGFLTVLASVHFQNGDLRAGVLSVL